MKYGLNKKIPQHFKCTLAIKPAQMYTWQDTKQHVSWLSVLLGDSQKSFSFPQVLGDHYKAAAYIQYTLMYDGKI